MEAATPLGASICVIDGAPSERSGSPSRFSRDSLPSSDEYLAPSGDRLRICNHWWYRTLLRDRGLFTKVSAEECRGRLIVCLQRPTQTSHWRQNHGKVRETERWYTCFDSYLEFYSYQAQIPPLKRSFYEVVLGHSPQKPHFDLDLDVPKFLEKYPESRSLDPEALERALDFSIQRCLESLIEGCLHHLPHLHPEKDFMIFSSHGPQKRSYHVVLPYYCYANHMEAKALYHDIMSLNLPDSWFIDHSVYSSKQQFRIIGSQKSFSGRPKLLVPSYRYKGQEYMYRLPEVPRNEDHENLILLSSSLLSFVSHCVYLTASPRLLEPKKWSGSGDIGDLSDDLVHRAFEIAHSYDSAFELRPGGVSGFRIDIDRIASSRCRRCGGVHDNENAFLTVRPFKPHDPSSPLLIYWHCRRDATQRGSLIGCLTDIPGNALPYPSEQEGTEQTRHDQKPKQDGPVFSFGIFSYPGVPSLPPPPPVHEEEPKEQTIPSPLISPSPLPPPVRSAPPLPSASQIPMMHEKMERAIALHSQVRSARRAKAESKKVVNTDGIFLKLGSIPW